MGLIRESAYKMVFGKLTRDDSQKLADALSSQITEDHPIQIVCERLCDHDILGKNVKLASQFGTEDLRDEKTKNQLIEHMSMATKTTVLNAGIIFSSVTLKGKEHRIQDHFSEAA